MAEVKCSAGHVAVVDDEDADLAELRWTSVVSKNARVYAARQKRIGPRKENKRLHFYMHRVIADRMGIVGHDIDHIDGNGLNNRRANLRGATRAENLRNVKGSKINSKSGHLGVTFVSNRWRVDIRIPGKRYYVGRFKTLAEAVSARLAAERQHWGIQPRRAGAHAA